MTGLGIRETLEILLGGMGNRPPVGPKNGRARK